MLTGTLVTVAGFIPIGFAQGGAAEYCFSLFAVVAMALLFSWIVAVLFAPLIGVKMPKRRSQEAARARREPGRLMRLFRASLRLAMRARYLVIIVTVALFAASVFGLASSSSSSSRVGPPGAAGQPDAAPDRLDQGDRGGRGPVREGAGRRSGGRALELLRRPGGHPFYLPLDVQLANDYFAQAVVVTKGYEVRDAVRARLEKVLNEISPT